MLAGHDRAGAPVGAEFQVNSYVTGIQQLPRIATDAAGNFVVAWSGEGDGSGNGTFGQRFNASGFPRGTQFTINSATAGDQGPVAVASDAVGNFVVTWASDGTGSDDVFGQRFGGLTPAALAVSTPRTEVATAYWSRR